jgi:hypothetical protein
MAQTPRCSSMVENFNSRLRNYFTLRRQLGGEYLIPIPTEKELSVHLQSVTFELSFGTNPFNVSPNWLSASHFERTMLFPRP